MFWSKQTASSNFAAIAEKLSKGEKLWKQSYLNIVNLSHPFALYIFLDKTVRYLSAYKLHCYLTIQLLFEYVLNSTKTLLFGE